MIDDLNRPVNPLPDASGAVDAYLITADPDDEFAGDASGAAVPALTLTEAETALLRQAQAGDPEAFDALQRALEPAIRQFIRRLIGDGEVDDLTQDVFLTFYRHLQRLDPPAKLRPFLYRVARNRCYDELRYRGRYDEITLDDEPISEWVSFQAPEALPPEDLAHWLLLHLEVREVMLDLPEAQRQALILYSEEGLSYAEIAEIMGTSLGTVKSRIYYAKRTLRRLLRPEVLAALDAAFTAEQRDPVDEAATAAPFRETA